jgi:hypothetical protein
MVTNWFKQQRAGKNMGAMKIGRKRYCTRMEKADGEVWKKEKKVNKKWQ